MTLEFPELDAPPLQSVEPRPIAFGPRRRRLFGWYHPAAAGARRGTGIVLCPPLGYEAICSHAAHRYLAERLAATGYPALRLDYDGTGDSTGSDADPGRVQAWVASVGQAIDALREHSGVVSAALFGTRLGATLATVAAADRGDVDTLLLWAPCRDGKSYLRELRAFRGMQGAAAQGESEEPAVPEREEFAGFCFHRETLDELSRLDPTAVEGLAAKRVLLIDRDDLAADGRLTKRLAARGIAVNRVAWPGYAAMMRDPHQSEMPAALAESLVTWLNEHLPATEPHAGPEPKPVPVKLEGEGYWEEPLGRSGAFGVLTHPRYPAPGYTAVLLLSAGATYRIGPNRMWVPLARELAACGLPVLRLDLPGVGDSARGDAQVQKWIYSNAAVEGVRDAMSELVRRLDVEQFVLVGLCSGAYTAYHAAARDPRVSGQVLINPQTFVWRHGDSLEIRARRKETPTKHYLRALRRPETWKRTLRGGPEVRRAVGLLSKRIAAKSTRAVQTTFSRLHQEPPEESPVYRRLREVSRRGTDTLFVYAAEDPGLPVMEWHLGVGARKMQGRRNFRLAVIPGADHTFTDREARKALLDLIVGHVLCTQCVLGSGPWREQFGSRSPDRGLPVLPRRR